MIILLILLVVILLVKVIGMELEIKNLTKQLDTDNFENQHLTLLGHSKSIKNLTVNIGSILNQKDELIINYRKKEKKAKENISSISHDLRTPLTSIIGYVQLMKKNENFKYIDILDKKTSSLHMLINDFFELSLLDESNIEVNLASYNIENILSSLIADFYNDLIAKNIELHVDIKSDNYTIVTDNKLFERILFNIMQNILRYARTFASIKLYKGDGYINLIISNDGNILTKEQCSLIFNRFYKADKSRKSVGSGIGLSIVKELTEKLSGTINAKVYNDIIEFKLKFKINDIK